LKPDLAPVDLSAYKAIEFYARGDGDYFVFLPEPSITDGDNFCTPNFSVTAEWKKVHLPLAGLKQNGWGAHRTYTQDAIQKIAFGAVVPSLQPIPSAMYNGMIHPFTPFPIGGVLWYQGEANLAQSPEYALLLENLIQRWREAWNQPGMPFLVAQLPLFMEPSTQPSESQWAEIREAQVKAADSMKAGLAVLLDLGESKDIHPKNKRDVGARLAYVALRTAFGRDDAPAFPIYTGVTWEGSKALLKFKDAGKGLRVEGKGPLKGFAAAGEDGKFHWAKASIKGDSVVVECKEAGKIQAVRYGWADNPDCNLFGKNGLPVSPFRTDSP
jgi:sialate O-acetylesterase